jgi:hypothetical protein
MDCIADSLKTVRSLSMPATFCETYVIPISMDKVSFYIEHVTIGRSHVQRDWHHRRNHEPGEEQLRDRLAVSHRILEGLRDDSGIFRKWRRIFMRAKVERMKSAL